MSTITIISVLWCTLVVYGSERLRRSYKARADELDAQIDRVLLASSEQGTLSALQIRAAMYPNGVCANLLKSRARDRPRWGCNPGVVIERPRPEVFRTALGWFFFNETYSDACGAFETYEKANAACAKYEISL